MEIATADDFVCGSLYGSDGIVCANVYLEDTDTDNSVIEEWPTEGSYSGLSAGAQRVCGLNADSEAECWGTSVGQIPVDTDSRPIKFTRLATGDWHTCGLTDSGKVLCWGRGAEGQLDLPVNMTFVDIAAAYNFTCGIREEDGVEVCWGGIARNLWQDDLQ